MPCSESPLDDRMLRKPSATLPWVAPRISSKWPWGEEASERGWWRGQGGTQAGSAGLSHLTFAVAGFPPLKAHFFSASKSSLQNINPL